MINERFSPSSSFWYCKDLRTSTGQSRLLYGRSRVLTFIRTSLITLKCSDSSKALSKTTIGRLPFKQFPVSFNSSIVWEFKTWNRIEGPLGAFAAHKYKSPCFLRASKKSALLQLDKSHNSFRRGSWCFESNFASFWFFLISEFQVLQSSELTFLGMRQEWSQIIHQMSLSLRNSSRW